MTLKTLDVRLQGSRVGILIQDERRNVSFIFDEWYVEQGQTRPLMSTSWYVPGDEHRTVARLRDTVNKQGRLGMLPPWFANLLPEGALRSMVERGLPTGHVADFDVIEYLGRDLPGAVEVSDGREAVQIELPSEPTEIPMSKLRFSLAGVQLKFSSVRRDDRLTLPAIGGTGNYIAKLPNRFYATLPEVEYSSMRLAAAAGIDVAHVRTDAGVGGGRYP